MNPPANDRTDGVKAGVTATADSPAAFAAFRPLRTWPALLLIGLMILARYAPAHFEGSRSTNWVFSVFGPFLGCVLMVVWWLAASRATWKERLLGLLGLGVGLGVTVAFLDQTMLGSGISYLTMPLGMMTFACGTVLLSKHHPAKRTGIAVLFGFLGFAFSLLLRNEGMSGEYAMTLRWRWTETPEERMMAGREPEPGRTAGSVDAGGFAIALANPEWPGFRGADRMGRSIGPEISTNWTVRPPRQRWKIPVGPAWSSFAVAGKWLFTQEQRGPMETVVCYDADSGREIWNRPFEGRLDDPLGGPGPRATPTLAGNGLFVTCATGRFLRLNPATGEIVWQHELPAVAGGKVPMWGFSASPLFTGSNVIVHAAGPGDKGLLAFDANSGALRWSAAAGVDSYSSPQLSHIAGMDLVLMLSNEGLLLVDPLTGKERLNYPWKVNHYRALQPHVVGEDTVLLPTGMNTGTRAIRISNSNGQLEAEVLWTSRSLKPDFTDLVSHHGFLYGVDGGIFTCVDLETGERKRKAGRYGKGQVLLLQNSGLLLVAAEQGDVVLLRADPNQHTELGSFKALEGKTWNHPVVVGDRLYVRNAQEAACFELPLAQAKPSANQP